MNAHYRGDNCLAVVVPFATLAARKSGAASALTPTAQKEQPMTVALRLSLEREEIVADLADHVLNYWPVTIGTGPYDLDVAQVNPCPLCDQRFTRPAFAFGFWHRLSADFVVLHPRCLREAESGVVA